MQFIMVPTTDLESCPPGSVQGLEQIYRRLMRQEFGGNELTVVTKLSLTENIQKQLVLVG